MKQLEVRCCCQPQKLLGFVTVPDHMARPGQILYAPVPAPPLPHVGRPYYDVDQTVPVPTRQPPPIPFPIESFYENGQRFIAVKGEGRTVEELELLLRPWRFKLALDQHSTSVA
jgi:hypothetical protein